MVQVVECADNFHGYNEESVEVVPISVCDGLYIRHLYIFEESGGA